MQWNQGTIRRLEQAIIADGDPLEVASDAETIAGLLTSKAVTPSGFIGSLVYFDVRTYGAVGDGSTDDTVAIQAAIDACAAVGGGIVFFPRALYLISASLTIPSFICLQGVGGAYRAIEYGIDPSTAASTIRQPSGSPSFPMVCNEDPTNGNCSIEIRGMRFNQSVDVGDNAIIKFDRVRRSLISDCYLRGAATTSRLGFHNTNSSEHNWILKSSLEGCGIKSNGSANSLIIRECEIGAGGIQLIGGFDHMIVNNDLYNDGVAAGAPLPYPYIISVSGCTSCQVIGNQVTSSLEHGIMIQAGVTRSRVIGNQVKNSSRETSGVWSGIALDSTGNATTNNVIANNVCWDTASASGTQQYGITVASTVPGNTNNNVIVGNVVTGNRSSACVNQTAGLTNIWRDNLGAPTVSVASAATITIPPNAELVTVSGTTTITSVTAGYANQHVVLVFSGALTFTDGSNLKLAGNFVTTADDTIALVCDGTNWIETARSVN